MAYNDDLNINDMPVTSGRQIKDNNEAVNIADMIEALYNGLIVNKDAGISLLGSDAGYDAVDDMFKIKSMQKKFRDAFPGTALRAEKWDTVLSGGSEVSVFDGNLGITSGVVANSESYILSKETFRIPFRLAICLYLTQRIANQTFFIEMVSVDPATGVPDGLNCAALHFKDTTATQGRHYVQCEGQPYTSSAVTFPTTGATTSLYEIEVFADEAWFHGGALDNTTARANSYRRHMRSPDPNALYKIRLRWLNGETAPASDTTALISTLSLIDYAELTAEITAGRGQSVAGQAIGVQVAGGSLTATVAGQAAHDAVVSGSPVRIGGRALTTNYTAVATGDVADIVVTRVGAQVVIENSIPEQKISNTLTVTAINDTTLFTAAGAGIRNYVTGLQLQNTGASATVFTLKDDSTVKWTCSLPANMTQPYNVDFKDPILMTANTAVNVNMATASSVYVNAQGYKAP